VSSSAVVYRDYYQLRAVGQVGRLASRWRLARRAAGDALRPPVNEALSLRVPGEGLRAAEDRGFEPRRVVTPNRISSAAP
jgi:hypothetical protein